MAENNFRQYLERLKLQASGEGFAVGTDGSQVFKNPDGTASAIKPLPGIDYKKQAQAKLDLLKAKLNNNNSDRLQVYNEVMGSGQKEKSKKSK